MKIIQLILLTQSVLILQLVKAQDSLPAFTRGINKVTLIGKISDSKSGEPLPGATVYFPDVKTGAVTNAHGEYRINNIPQGRYLVEVSYLGYAPVIEQVPLTGNMQKDFQLNPSFKENEAVIVTGVSSATSARRTPIPVNIVSKSDLFRISGTNVIDALTKTPGVAQVSTGPAISKPFVRGLGYNRVVVINDGVRQEGQQWGDEHGTEVDEFNVSKIEVLKGPASIMYGSDALAGVINFISFIPSPEGSVKGNVFGSYQTNNRQRGFHADFAGNNHGFVWGASGSFKAAADYRNRQDGYVFNSKFNEKNFGGYVGLNKTWGFTHLYLTKFDQEVGLVEGDRDAAGRFTKLINNNGNEETAPVTEADFRSVKPYVPRQHILHTKLVTDNSFNIGAQRLTLTVGYQRNQRQEFGNILIPGEKSLYFDLRTFTYNVKYHLNEQKGWKSSFGMNGMQQSSRNLGIEVLIPEYELFDFGIFIFSQKRFEKLTMSVGARFDNRSLDFDKTKKDFSNFSGSAGISYEASNTVTLKFNLARGFRAPSIPELASNGAHEGTNRFEYGQQNLRSEKSIQADAGLELNSEHISFTGNLFINSINDFIYYRKLESTNGGDSIINDQGDDFFAFQFDQSNAKLYGAELIFDIHPHPLDWLHVENSFSFVRGMLSAEQDGSKNLPFIPAARLVNEVKGDFWKKGKHFRNLYVRVELDNTFAQNHPFSGFNTETRTAGYSLLNAGIGADVMKNEKILFNFSFAANNITDVAYQNHLSRLKYAPENPVTGRTGVFNMGRTFSFKINVPLNFKKLAS